MSLCECGCGEQSVGGRMRPGDKPVYMGGRLMMFPPSWAFDKPDEPERRCWRCRELCCECDAPEAEREQG